MLNKYCVSVKFPDVSGAEHLEMLQIRDRLAEIESDLSEAEKTLLIKGDRQLIENVNDFYRELSCFVNLADIRKAEAIPPRRWWWYLDVLVFLPISLKPRKLTDKLWLEGTGFICDRIAFEVELS
ncbi:MULTISPECIES: hypothetical protein [unclassified Microcoleus]|uniref:hypothetical protein n=1 Tax=unclassified Microcoleus TaxID=2642155 RepID=UPI002FD2D5A7